MMCSTDGKTVICVRRPVPPSTDYAPGEFTDDAGVLDGSAKSLVLRIRRPAARVEDVRVDEDVLLSR